MLNVLHVVTRYRAILAQTNAGWVPRTVIFAGKAASSYVTAKSIIRLIHDVGQVINHDARIGDKESTDRAVGEVQHYRSLIEKPIRERHADERTANEQRTRLNEAIIKAHRTGQAMTSAATETARTTKAEATAARKKRMSANAALAEAARANLANQEI